MYGRVKVFAESRENQTTKNVERYEASEKGRERRKKNGQKEIEEEK